MLDFTRKLTISSAASYLPWRARKVGEPINLELRSGERFQLRPKTTENNDYGVAFEIFVEKQYEDRYGLVPADVNLIVDLGANVGYTLLYHLHRYPRARVIAFEPHPKNAAQAERNLILDRNRDRVDFHRAAAGAQTRTMRLSDQATSSMLTDHDSPNTFEVDVVDIFPLLEGKRIDIFKMDIEGGEYEILADSRFGQLDIGALIMEWHSRGAGVIDKEWCEQRLKSFGFEIKNTFTNPDYGMFWAAPRRR